MLRRVTQVTIVTVVLAVVLGALAAPTTAITGNVVQDTEHPFVGLVAFYDADAEFLWRCSGSLLTPIVFLTAGHCTGADAEEGTPVTARVYFQQDAGFHYDPETELDPVSGYPETCAGETLGTLCATSDELYNYGFADFDGFPDIKDLGLVILDQSIDPGEYGALAVAGSIDQLATQRGQQDLTFTVSGFGLTDAREHPPTRSRSTRERLMAEAKLINTRSAQLGGFGLQTSANPGGGRGGTCSGDSGGPVFYGPAPSNTIVAVTSWGISPWCTGVDFSFRTDTEAAIAWILDTVPDDQAGLIEFVELQTRSGETAGPSADGNDKDTGKNAKPQRGKAKAEKHTRGKGNGHRQR